MIRTKEDLQYYLLCDKNAMGIEYKKPRPFRDKIWKLEILYRKTEYHYNNQKDFFHKIAYILYFIRFKKMCADWGTELPLNVVEEGFVIWHGQNIIINPNAKIGKNFSISAGCCVGQAHDKSPIIGDNVEMTIGSKVLGGITVVNDVTIGAGAVVVKDIAESYTTWGGVPAKCISRNINTYVAEKKKRLEKILRK